MERRLNMCIAAFMSLAPLAAIACGDKLAVIGGGVPYERLAKGMPRGDVVLLLEPDSSVRQANDDLNLKRALEFAGHKVRTVDSASALSSVVAQGKTDVVLVPWQEASRLQAQYAAQPASPVVLPVAYRTNTPPTETAAAPEVRCIAQADRRKGRDLVETVSIAVQQRKAGKPVDCSAGTAARTE